MQYLCECDRPDCYERVKASRKEYESVRADATHFIVLAGHEDRLVERVGRTRRRGNQPATLIRPARQPLSLPAALDEVGDDARDDNQNEPVRQKPGPPAVSCKQHIDLRR